MKKRARLEPRADVDDFTDPQFTVFTDYDIANGKISSTFPLWYFRNIKEELQANIMRMERSLKEGYVPEARIPEFKENLLQLNKRLQTMNDSMEKLNKKDFRDFVHKVTASLSEKISNALPSAYEMEKGLIPPHEEARRMTEPCIALTDDEVLWAKRCNISVYHNMVSRTEAERMWKIGRSILGEDTNVERLRKDR